MRIFPRCAPLGNRFPNERLPLRFPPPTGAAGLGCAFPSIWDAISCAKTHVRGQSFNSGNCFVSRWACNHTLWVQSIGESTLFPIFQVVATSYLGHGVRHQGAMPKQSMCVYKWLQQYPNLLAMDGWVQLCDRSNVHSGWHPMFALLGACRINCTTQLRTIRLQNYLLTPPNARRAQHLDKINNGKTQLHTMDSTMMTLKVAMINCIPCPHVMMVVCSTHNCL